MMKKRISFAPLTKPRSPNPLPSSSSLAPVSHSPCPPQAPTSGPRPVPPSTPRPDQTNVPYLIIGPAPLLPARKARSLRRFSSAPCTPCPVNAPSSASVPVAQQVPHTASHLLPKPPPDPFLAFGPLGRGQGSTGFSPPPAGSPLPSISPPLDCPANCPKGQESLPQGNAQRFRCPTSVVCREQNTVESIHR